MSLHEILAQHRRASQGMTYGSPDRCLCGEKVYPESGGEDVDVRRHRAFAAHQAKVLDAHPALEAGVTLTEAEAALALVVDEAALDGVDGEGWVREVIAVRQAPTVGLDVETVAATAMAHYPSAWLDHGNAPILCRCGDRFEARAYARHVAARIAEGGEG